MGLAGRSPAPFRARLRLSGVALGRSLNELAFFYRFDDRDDDHGRGRRRPHHGFLW